MNVREIIGRLLFSSVAREAPLAGPGISVPSRGPSTTCLERDMFRVGTDEQTACQQFGRTKILSVLQAEMGANQSIAQLVRYVADHPVVGGAQNAALHLQAAPGAYGGLAEALAPYSTGQVAWMLFSAANATADDESLAVVLKATKLTGLWLPQRATLRMEGLIERDVLVH